MIEDGCTGYLAKDNDFEHGVPRILRLAHDATLRHNWATRRKRSARSSPHTLNAACPELKRTVLTE
ncbi:MAG: hypothetical protein R2856_00655 [Caldilineaceae bacterium]